MAWTMNNVARVERIVKRTKRKRTETQPLFWNIWALKGMEGPVRALRRRQKPPK